MRKHGWVLALLATATSGIAFAAPPNVPSTTASVPPHPPVAVPKKAAPIAADAPAASPFADVSGVVDMETVMVHGIQPGPGLWKVTGKDGHVLWVLGTLAPLPEKMEWDSSRVDKIIAESQEVITSPSVGLDADVGIVGGLFLLPSLLKARKNPDGESLADAVGPAAYARWQPLKARYIGSDRGVESYRPLFAALELYEKAIKKSGMTERGLVQPMVRKAAKAAKVPVTEPKYTIKVDNAKATIKEFSGAALADRACFTKTLDVIDTDLAGMAGRANAWAIGDIDALRTLPSSDQYAICRRAITEAEFAKNRGLTDLPARVQATWLAAAEAALAKNTSTLALLPMSQLTRTDGYLSKLEAKGFEVEAP